MDSTIIDLVLALVKLKLNRLLSTVTNELSIYSNTTEAPRRLQVVAPNGALKSWNVAHVPLEYHFPVEITHPD